MREAINKEESPFQREKQVLQPHQGLYLCNLSQTLLPYTDSHQRTHGKSLLQPVFSPYVSQHEKSKK